ncbi:hypothetical protein K466DRAFT_464209, partial [Polyporus arcularius HHB13444]
TEPFFAGMKGDHPVVNTCIFLVLVLNLLYHVTLPACRLTIKILKQLLRIAWADELAHNGSGAEQLQSVLASIPADVSTSIKHLNIFPETNDYACCPSCFALYLP